MRNKKQKGFTLVELLVVIAIIAILAAVSVVGYLSFTNKAHAANDSSLTVQMNTILQANEATNKATCMKDVIEQLNENGVNLEKINPETKDAKYLWDSSTNRIILLDADKKALAPVEATITDKAKAFALIDSNEEVASWAEYSLYLRENFDATDITVSNGVDVGVNKGINVTYTDTATEVVELYTNGGKTTINNANADVNHHGTSTDVEIQAVASNSYHLFGEVIQGITVKDGTAHVVIEATAKVSEIKLDNEAETNKITVKDNKEDLIVSSTKPAAKVTINKEGEATGKVKTSVEIKPESNIKEEDKVVGQLVKTQKELEEKLLEKKEALIILGADIKLEKADANDALIVKKGYSITLDLNGNTLEADLRTGYADRHNYGIGNHGNLIIMDSSVTKAGIIKSRGVENFNKLTVLSGTLEATDKSGGAAIWNEGDLLVLGGTFIAGASKDTVGEPGDSAGVGCLNNRGTAIIKAGKFTDGNRRTYAIISTGNIICDPLRNEDLIVEGAHGGLAIDSGIGRVNGGIYKSTEYYGLYVSNDGMGIDPEIATVEIYGGEFTGKTYSVWVGSDYNNPVNSSITIFNGKFNQLINAKEASNDGISVRGGEYLFDINNHPEQSVYRIEDDYKVVKTGSTWTVVEK